MKKGKVSPYEIFAVAIIFCAATLRVVLAGIGWPATNADEGTMGIMALHIAYRGERPLLFYGQNYMGVLEAYLGAGFFHLLGPSVFSLRLGVILLTTLFFLCMYLLTSLLYSKSLAIVTLLFLCFGSIPVFSREMLATGGSTQTLLFGALAFLGALWLAKTAYRAFSWQGQCWRLLGYFSWGIVLGLGLWSDMVVLPFFAMAALLLCAFCWGDLLRRAWLPVLAGILLGALPLILYNIQNMTHSKDSFSTLLGLFQGTQTHAPHTLPQIFYGFWSTLVVSVPTATGNPFCPVQELPWLSDNTVQTVPCIIGHAIWGFGYLALLLWSMFLIIIVLLRRNQIYRVRNRFIGSALVGAYLNSMIYRAQSLADAVKVVSTTLSRVMRSVFRRGGTSPRPYEKRVRRSQKGLNVVWQSTTYLGERVDAVNVISAKRDEQLEMNVVLLGRLALLGGGLLAILAYALSSAPMGWPGFHARYLVGLLMVTPAVIAPLWGGIIAFFPSPRRHQDNRRRPYSIWTQYTGSLLVLLTIFTILLIGTGMLLSEVPAAQAADKREADLIRSLERRGISHVYTDYWTCDRLAFVSNEHIICGVIDGSLQLSHNRAPRYAQLVGSDPHSSYLLPIGAGQLAAVELLVALHPGTYQRYTLDGYIVYQRLL